MKRAVNVKPLLNYLLLIRFDNGEERVFNCFPLLENDLYKKIEDQQFFQTVHIDDMGLVCWDDSMDINPYELYNNSESISHFVF